MPDPSYVIAARTDKGIKRSANEDAVAILNLPQTQAAFVLADGMGGLSAGDIAAQDTIRMFEETLTAKITDGTSDLDAALRESAEKANHVVYTRAEERRAQMPKTKLDDYEKGDSKAKTALMGSTVVAGIVRNDTLHLLHAGDSRAYLLNRNGLKRLTSDHSFVEERVRAGDITEAEARKSQFRNIVTRAIGIAEVVKPEVQAIPLTPGDQILVCSDGLNGMLTDAEIAQILKDGKTAKRAAGALCEELTNAANDAGGSDNITIILIRVPGDTESLLSQPDDTTIVTMHASDPPKSQKETPPQGRAASIVDIDNPRNSPRKSVSPLVALLTALGVLALLMAAILGISDAARQRVVHFLSPAKSAPINSSTVVPKPTPPADLAKVEYFPPATFGNRGARGDLLIYSPGVGLYFITLTTNNLVALKPDGTPAQSAAARFPEPVRTQTVPLYVATDAQGNVYVSVTARKLIEKRSPQGRVLKVIGGLERPEAIAVDDVGNIYVVDFSLIKIIRVKTAQNSAKPAAPPAPASVPPVKKR